MIEKEFEIVIYSEFSSELETEWKYLQDIVDHYIYQKYSWNEYWARIFDKQCFFRIVIVKKQGLSVGVFPFCVNKFGVIKKLQFIGIGQSDYMSPILNYNL